MVDNAYLNGKPLQHIKDWMVIYDHYLSVFLPMYEIYFNKLSNKLDIFRKLHSLLYV